MILKMPSSILVTDLEELREVLNKRKRKKIILFVDMRKFNMSKEKQLLVSERLRAIRNLAKLEFNRKAKDLIMFIDEKYSERKRLV